MGNTIKTTSSRSVVPRVVGTTSTATSEQYNYWLSKVRTNGSHLEKVPENLRNDKAIVLAAVQQRGWALDCASEILKRDKDVVLAAVKQDPDALRFAHEDLQRNPDVLIAAGMFDDKSLNDSQQYQQEGISTIETVKPQRKKITLSTRFALDPNAKGFSEATRFTKLFKEQEYIRDGNFKVYAPNAFNKRSCDPNWTNYDWPCRGTRDTCQFDDALKTGRPTSESCWRYSFRYHLQEAKLTGGFMLQLVEKENSWSKEPPSLGKGQRVEWDMARDLEMKVFQVYRPVNKQGFQALFYSHHVEDAIVPTIRNWYDEGCVDMSECVIRTAHRGQRERPYYNKYYE